MGKSKRKPEEIEIIARALALREGRVLLCRSVKGQYAYLPGGHVEPEELATEACARELLEETGVEASVGPCLLIAETRFHDGRKARHELNLVFHVELPPGLRPDEPKSREPKIAFEWLDLAAVYETDIRPRCIKAWLASGEFTPPPPLQARQAIQGTPPGAPRPLWISDPEDM